MLEIGIMIEGQNGLNWQRWQTIAKAVEDLGFHSLFRSDHYTNANPPDLDSLELWVSLTWLATNTSRIEFGPLVSPVSFRQPTMTARMAAAVDDLSNGRLILGLGAGWQEREHTNYGWDLLDVGPRMDRFEEGLEVISALLQSNEPSNFSGAYYNLNEGILLPRPQRLGGPPILIGGNGPKRTLPLTAKFATEWNGLFLTADGLKERNERLDSLLAEYEREAAAVKRSLMTGLYFGRDSAEVDAKLAARNRTKDQLREFGIIVGTGGEVVDQLNELAEAGLQRVMLQWLDLDDLDGLEALAAAILPHFT